MRRTDPNEIIRYCIQFILYWIATSDGVISEEENTFIDETLGSFPDHEKREIVSKIYKGDVEDFSFACELCTVLDQKQKGLLLELAIMVALSDGVLAIPEIHILYFLSDVFGVGITKLEDTFKDVTGREFPSPSDISDKDWWEKRKKRQSKSQKESYQKANEESDQSTTRMTKMKAYAILGLEGDESPDEIKKAYRRLANVHHPDKFHNLGQEAVEVATSTFKRINEAYEYLRD